MDKGTSLTQFDMEYAFFSRMNKQEQLAWLKRNAKVVESVTWYEEYRVMEGTGTFKRTLDIYKLELYNKKPFTKYAFFSVRTGGFSGLEIKQL